jgi:radical SAM protein with 4Fe4S-binding SPASM domain
MLDRLLSKLSSPRKDQLNSLPVIQPVNGIPLHISPYISHRNHLGLDILAKCAAKTPDQYTIEELWKAHPDFPIAACFNVHSLCNERCVMCPYQVTDGAKPTRIMDLGNFKKTWDEFAGLGGRIATFNNFSDIFAHPAGMDYVRVALQDQDRVSTYFVTNGLSLKKEYVDEIISSGWSNIIYVSCHAFSEETFYKVTGVNTFRRVVENTKYMAARHPDPSRIIIQYATDFSSQEEVQQALSFWGELGCTVNTFSTHTFAGNSNHRTETAKPGRLAGCKGWGYDAGQLFFQAVIQQNGNLTLCCHDLQGKVVIGNVFEDGLANTWKSKRMKNLIRLIYRGGNDPKTMEICRKCSLAQVVME